MSSKKKPKRRGKKQTSTSEQLQLAAESRTATSVTVAWTLSVMATLAAEGLGFFCQAYLRWFGDQELLRVLGAVMLFVALIAGLATLVLTPVASRIAKTKPPKILIQVAYVAGVLPIITLVLQYLQDR